MPAYHNIFKTVANKVNLLPINAVSYYSYEEQVGFHFMRVESESSFKVTPQTQMNDLGQVIPYGYAIEVNTYIPYNSFNSDLTNATTYLRWLHTLNGKRVHTQIALGNTSNWYLLDGVSGASPNVPINSTSGLVVDLGENCSFIYEIESVEFRPRLIIRQTGFIASLINLQVANTLNTTGNTNDLFSFS